MVTQGLLCLPLTASWDGMSWCAGVQGGCTATGAHHSQVRVWAPGAALCIQMLLEALFWVQLHAQQASQCSLQS